MRKILPFLPLLLIFGCSKVDQSSASPDPDSARRKKADEPNLESITTDDNRITANSRSKADILAYFDALIADKKVIAGQHCGDGADATASYYNDYIDVLADRTGRHVGLMGADLGFFPSNDYPVRSLIDHWKEGGLVTVSWHTDNPFVDGYDPYWNTVENKSRIDFDLLLSDADHNQFRTNYRTELDNIAGALQRLRDAEVTVIWRPFHEMNSNFFWCGTNAYDNQQTNEADFKKLWIDLYNTLTFEYGLDNLIWTYSVIPYHGWNADVIAFYPGSDYVDLVGIDYYGVDPDFPDYGALKSLGKTVVMSESGPKDAGYGNWDMVQFVNIIKGKAAYFLQWHSWNDAAVSIKDNKNTVEIMNSESVITRGEILPTSF